MNSSTATNLPPIHIAIAKNEYDTTEQDSRHYDNIKILEQSCATFVYFSIVDDDVLPSNINLLYISSKNSGKKHDAQK